MWESVFKELSNQINDLHTNYILLLGDFNVTHEDFKVKYFKYFYCFSFTDNGAASFTRRSVSFFHDLNDSMTYQHFLGGKVGVEEGDHIT